MTITKDHCPTIEPPKSTYAPHALRNNSHGTDLDKEALERFKIREICEGWGSYRDAAEWQNYLSMFFPDAYITTSWHSGPIDSFLQSSKDAFARGPEFMDILHRMLGCAVETDEALTRAGGKMKVTITVRFNIDGVETDVDADCRFFFFLEKREGRWGVVFFTLLFDKDRLVPVNPGYVLKVPEEEIERFPSGYRYLAWAEEKVGVKVRVDLNAHGPERDALYAKCRGWLEGKDVLVGVDGSNGLG
ncbi:uncharacterized protein BO80DRAFT_473518 [Aspergillus ibericus CBS 121593]|uniref:SnoaL-like domain-containing protein n=1 Tax=Aspergillus ibericus CBS 121593 TaxID=1448316 RepID=A0A395H1J2_9EURO|nr:hypothetical protein BO80DRAFT_473518 [Aspergillus ibericus CBS 121593]RAL01717.1 hypothetical protein BO80DRAFT_473518 [Aspergillus ibericus CBS 121593]